MSIRIGNRYKTKDIILNSMRGGMLALGVFMLVAAPASASALSSSTLYDATPSTLPPNVESWGFESISTSEMGDRVRLEGTKRKLGTVTLTMSNWAPYSQYMDDDRYSGNSATWTHPVTVNIYGTELDENGEPSNLIATKLQSVTVPWRPAKDPSCNGDRWKASNGNCYSGIAFNAAFDMSRLNITLPNEVIVTFAYNTRDYGANPIGVSGPYDSLNIGAPTNQQVSVGQDLTADTVFWDTTWPEYSPGLREDSGWTGNGTIAFKISTPDLKNKEQCKENGWKVFDVFKNQGDCVSSVTANSKSNR